MIFCRIVLLNVKLNNYFGNNVELNVELVVQNYSQME